MRSEEISTPARGYAMSDEKVLTKEIAEQFLADENSVRTWEFATIEDAAAESLSKRERYLNLIGLTSLP